MSKPGLRVDVGATTYFSEIAMTQTLDNLRRDGTLDVIQYLERVPDKLIPKKEELIRQLRSRSGAGAAAGDSGPAQQEAVMAALPANAQRMAQAQRAMRSDRRGGEGSGEDHP